MPNHGKKSSVESAKSRPLAETTKTDEKDNMFDSGRADSGFLSGGSNLLSNFSEEISRPQPDDYSREERLDSKSYSRLDSGVGLSDQMSDLCLHEDYDCERGSSPTLVSKMNIASPQPEEVKQAEESTQYLNDCFQQDEYGDTQLHIAVMTESEQSVNNLIRIIPSSDYLDIRNKMRQTALHIAVFVSSPKIVECLIAAGARRDSVDHHGNTPLHWAVTAGDVPVVRALLRKPSSPGRLRYSPLYRQPRELNVVNYEGLSCVHLAMLHGHIDLVRELVRAGADVNARDYKSGKGVLHIAAERGDIATAEMLVRELAADRYLLTYAGESAYRLAAGSAATAAADAFRSLGAYAIGDSDDDDDDHLGVHEDDPDYQGYAFRELQTNGYTITA